MLNDHQNRKIGLSKLQFKFNSHWPLVLPCVFWTRFNHYPLISIKVVSLCCAIVVVGCVYACMHAWTPVVLFAFQFDIVYQWMCTAANLFELIEANGGISIYVTSCNLWLFNFKYSVSISWLFWNWMHAL